MKNTKEYDIIIVGAGAAGLGAANELAKSDIKVLLIDRGDKHHDLCTPYSFVKEIGIEKAVINKFSFYSFYSKNYELIRKTGKKYLFAFISQEKARKILMKNLRCHVLNNTEIVNAEYRNGFVDLVDHKNNDYRAKIVLDCSGTAAVVATNLGVDVQSSVYFFCYVATLNSCDIKKPRELSFNINKEYSNVATWIYPYNRNKVQFGISDMLPYKITTKDNLRARIIKTMKEAYPYDDWLKNSKINNKNVISKIYPASAIKCAVADNLIIVGDAAGHALPYAGEGFKPSFEIGREAAKIAEKALKENNPSKKRLIEFERVWWDKFGKYDFWAVIARHIGVNCNNEEHELVLKKLKGLTNDEFFDFIGSRYSFKLFHKIIGFKLLLKYIKNHLRIHVHKFRHYLRSFISRYV